MTGIPDDPAWLEELLRRTPLLPDPAHRRRWIALLPWLSQPARYELAAILVGTEQAVTSDEPRRRAGAV